jgi:hypothetical protein
MLGGAEIQHNPTVRLAASASAMGLPAGCTELPPWQQHGVPESFL